MLRRTLFLLLLLLCFLPSRVTAEMYLCEGPDGQRVARDTPCGTEKNPDGRPYSAST